MLESSKEGRNINRHYYTAQEVQAAVARPVVADLLELLTWRNQFAAFDLDGTITVTTPSDNELKVVRTDRSGEHVATLVANAQDKTFTITADGETVLKNR